MPGSGAGGDGYGGGGLGDGVAQQGGGEERAGWLAGVAGGVEADDGVEVDDAACLVFGDLDVADRDDVAELGEGQAGEAGEVAGQVGGEPAPQVTGVGVEQHGGGVVVAVGTQRAAKQGVVVGVAARAGDVAAVRAAALLVVASRSAGQHGLAALAPGVDRAEGGGGEGGEHARVGGDGRRDALAAGQSGADELAGVALVHREQAGQTVSRRFPHAVISTPPGSAVVS